MNIPDKAFTAADHAGYEAYAIGGAQAEVAEAAVKAAAKFIAAQAIHDAADKAMRDSPDDGVSPHWLRVLAYEIAEQ